MVCLFFQSQEDEEEELLELQFPTENGLLEEPAGTKELGI